MVEFVDIFKLYCLFFIMVVFLRWIYYCIKKWYYYFLVMVINFFSYVNEYNCIYFLFMIDILI